MIDQLKNDYKKVSNDNFVENDWNLEGKKITINMNSFQKLMKDLTKKVDYVKISNIEDNKTKKIANKIELDLQNAKNNIEPMILAIKNKISTYANDFQKAANQEQERENEQNEEKGQELVMDLMNDKDYLEQRRKELESIHKTAAEMKEITDKMAQDVEEQGVLLNNVEENVIKAEDNAKKAKQEIVDADKLSKGNIKHMKIFIIIIIIALVGIGLLIWFIVKKLTHKVKPLFILIEIGHFAISTEPPEATFRVYFKKIHGKKVLDKTTYFLIFINYTSIDNGNNIDTNTNVLRSLQQNDVKSDCNKVTSDNDDNIKYDCSFPVEKDKSFSTIFLKDNFYFSDSESFQIITSSLANMTLIEGIQNSEGSDFDTGVVVLRETELEEKNLNFNLEGEIKEGISGDKITLYFDDNSKKIKSATCDIKSLKKKKYKFNCNIENNIKAHLTGVIGKTNLNEIVVISMKEGAKEILEDKSKKLSGGAIAAIIISCIVVLVVLALVIKMYRKKIMSALFQ